MRKMMRHTIKTVSAIMILSYLIVACANIGNPNGGPYDEEPPKFVGSKPKMNQLNFTGKEIEVLFDELISVDNPSENVIITPPQKMPPVIQAVGKKVRVELKDTLKENTTYTIDFTSSIADSNEKNALENFSFAFSTGDVIDSLEISGVLLNAEDLEPVQKMLVGIHNNLSDTAFVKVPLLRTSKTDERGRFTIRNIAPGRYHLFALEDKNRNYSYDKNGGESLAFLDSVIVPSCERGMVPDTVWKDTITIDTVRMVEKTLFYPNDVVLWFFNDSVPPKQRMMRPERLQDHIFTLKFNAPMDTFPDPVPLNFEPKDSTWYIVQKGDDQESFDLNYWILDSMIYNMDTLKVELSYWKHNDTVPDLLELQMDTLSLVNREAAKSKRAASKKKIKVRKTADNAADSTDEAHPEPVIPLQVNVSPSGSLNPYDEIMVTFNEPVLDVRKDFFSLEQEKDSAWVPVEFEFVQDSTVAMTYRIKRTFKYEENYRLVVDSARLIGVYGHSNDSIGVAFKVRTEKEYGSLTIAVGGLPMLDSAGVIPAFVELLNSMGMPVRRVQVEGGKATFIDMGPEKYYARLVLDANGNGKWDGGCYEEQRKPEQVIYFNKQFEIRANWTLDETWNINASSKTQKPAELLKNKPKEEVKKKRDYREESRPRNSRNSSTNIRGLGGGFGF